MFYKKQYSQQKIYNYINKQTKDYCIRCNSKDIDHATRVIGYLRKITNFSKERQTEESVRFYHKE